MHHDDERAHTALIHHADALDDLAGQTASTPGKTALEAAARLLRLLSLGLVKTTERDHEQ